MKATIRLNGRTISESDYKTILTLYNCLSGLSFKSGRDGKSWLDKMSSPESYKNYLSVKAKELNVVNWSGKLEMIDSKDEIVKVHFFNEELTNSVDVRKDAL